MFIRTPVSRLYAFMADCFVTSGGIYAPKMTFKHEPVLACFTRRSSSDSADSVECGLRRSLVSKFKEFTFCVCFMFHAKGGPGSEDEKKKKKRVKVNKSSEKSNLI